MVAGSRSGSSKGISFLHSQARVHQGKAKKGHKFTVAMSSPCPFRSAFFFFFLKALFLSKDQHDGQDTLQHNSSDN